MHKWHEYSVIYCYQPISENTDSTCRSHDDHDESTNNKYDDDRKQEKVTTETSLLPLKQCLFSSENLLHSMWHSMNWLRFGILLGGMNIWLYDITGRNVGEGE